MDYADYHHAMAQHATALANSNQLHPAMAQIPMLSAAGLNLTVGTPIQVMSTTGQMNSHGQQGVAQLGTQHHVLYQNVQQVQPQQHQIQVQQQQQQQQHQVQQQGGHHGGSGHGHGNQSGHGGHLQHNASHKAKKKAKVNKDGVPAPKRATTAYINFTQWYREELKKSGRPIPKVRAADLMKECAAKWNSMSEEEKSPFLETAARDRDRYKREMQVYKPPRDETKPKRPGTAFMLFMVDFRKQMAGKEPEGGVSALAKLGGERWRNMSDEEKRPYVERQNEEKMRYEQAMEEYRRKV